MDLTRDNYYTPEADWAYMSCSQYQGWCECEAKQMAKLQGRWVDEPKEAFLVGNYFHTHFEGPEAHEQFCQEHFEEIYKTKTLKDKATGLETVVATRRRGRSSESPIPSRAARIPPPPAGRPRSSPLPRPPDGWSQNGS